MSETQSWNIDPAHSSIDFSVKHMGIFTVRGTLGTITGAAQTADGAITSAALSIDITKISTNNEQRDGHLKSADFLNVEAHPTIDFKSTGIQKTSDSEFVVTGDLTIVGKTASVSVTLEVVPPVKDPWGNLRAGVTGSGSLSRKDWGLTYNSVLETGHMLVGDEIKFTIDIQGTAA